MQLVPHPVNVAVDRGLFAAPRIKTPEDQLVETPADQGLCRWDASRAAAGVQQTLASAGGGAFTHGAGSIAGGIAFRFRPCCF